MESAARAPRWVILETSDGRKLAGCTSFGLSVIAGSGVDLFDWVEQEDGRVALRSLATEKFIGASADGVSASRGEIGEDALFQPIESEDGRVAFRLADGVHYLSAPLGDGMPLSAEATAGGPTERFLVTPFDLSRLPKGRSGCCSAWTIPEEDESPGTLWNDWTHRMILKEASAGLGRPGVENENVWRFRWFWGLPGFASEVERGLDDADYKAPWRGQTVSEDRERPRQSVFTWHDHFCNPTTGLNYMNSVINPTSAVTEGRRWFNLSVHAAARILKMGDTPPRALVEKAGHCLGVALHFLTDLTQPMHSGNFTNFFGEDGFYPKQQYPRWADRRHSGLEHWAEMKVQGGYLSHYPSRFPLSPQDVDVDDIGSVTSFLDWTVKHHHFLFVRKGGLLDLAREKVKTESSSWGSEADAALQESLLLAPKLVSRFLTYWSRCASQTWDSLDQGAWYRLLEPTKNEWVCLDGSNHYKRGTLADGRDLLFFLFNPDGTWSIGCKADPRRIWLGYDCGGWHWIKGNSEPGSEPAPTSRFRLVRDASVQGDTVWIYEATQDEAVTVGPDVPEAGRLCRSPACWPRQQRFRLAKVGPMSEAERNRIREFWPEYHSPERPWYGKT